MKKTLLSLALITASVGASATELYNGRVSGMGGAGYATAGYADGVLYNPSLLANFGESDDGALVLNLGALAQDPDDTLDNLDNLVDLTDRINTTSTLNVADAEELKHLLGLVDEKTLQVTGGGSLAIAIPTNVISAALIAKATFAVSASPNVSDSDFNTIDSAICLGTTPSNCSNFVPETSLTSEVTARGVVVQEVGIALAKSFDLADGSRLLVGVTPKRVEVDTIVYTANIANFDEDDIDADEYQLNGSTTSFDAGVTLIQGNISYSLTAANIASKDFKAIDGGKYELATRTTAAIGYSTESLRAEAAVDLNAIPVYGLPGDTQMFRAGVEFSPLSWVQFRAGYQSDLESTLPDAFTVGLGLSPFDTINLDLAAIKGSDDAIGGALQLGLRF